MSEHVDTYTEKKENAEKQLALLEAYYQVLKERYEHDKKYECGEPMNMLPFFVVLNDNSCYDTTKFIKPMMKAYRSGMRKKRNVIRSYDMLARLNGEYNGKEVHREGEGKA